MQHELNASRLNTSEARKGKPLAVPPLLAVDPYARLPEASGCGDSEPRIDRIGKQVVATQKLALSGTVICKTEDVPRPDDRIGARLNRLAPTLTSRIDFDPAKAIFILDSVGSAAAQLTLQPTPPTTRISPYDICSSLGGFDAKSAAHQNALRGAAGSLYSRHLENLGAIVDCPPKGIVLETGAEADYERLRLIDAHARERGGRLICHDNVPAAAYAAAKHLPGIPYVALPPCSALMEAALRSPESPLVITAKNVITVMNVQMLDELLLTAKGLAAERLLITQSYTPYARGGLFPYGRSPIEEHFPSWISDRVRNDHRALYTAAPASAWIVPEIARSIYYTAMLELELDYLTQRALDSRVFSTRRVFTECVQLDLQGAAASAFLSGQGDKRFGPLWESGAIDTISVGPYLSGVIPSRENQVPKGHLRVRSMQLHVEFSKNGAKDIPAPLAAESRIDGIHDQDGFCLPRQARAFHPSFGQILQCLAPSDFPFAKNPETLDSCFKAAGELTVRYLFEELAPQKENWLIATCLTPEHLPRWKRWLQG